MQILILSNFTSELPTAYFMHPFNLSLQTGYVLGSFTTLVIFWVLVIAINRLSPTFIGHLLPIQNLINNTDEMRSIDLQERFHDEVQYSESETIVANRLQAISVIDERISGLRNRSALMLLSIGFLLIAAAVTIIFAGSLTNLDVSAASDVDRITQDIGKLETRLALLSEILDLKKNMPVDGTAKDEVVKRISSLKNYDSTLPLEQEALSTEINSVHERLTLTETILKEAWDKQLQSEHGYSDTRYLIATAITRIGVVLIIVFLVQILIGLYRYNARLVTFYNSRRDTLQLCDGKPTSIDKIQKVMAPNIDFGKEPKHPLEELMKQVISKMNVGKLPGT